ncbi:MAG TPA: deoxyribose-phosphate aldolase [Clostridiales bacterium]|jgi:deoxyribose-phosphate aldolase|nr:deoxyribose-phosphate aldolase [Clostridiales bacterium]
MERNVGIVELSDILKRIDHTILKPDTTIKDIYKLCDEAEKYKFASVCLPPCFVREASHYAGGRVKICSVIGFPMGYGTTASKEAEARELISLGADELDMVINIGRLKNKEYDYVSSEIGKLKSIAGDKILKVIVETGMLTDEEKIKMCQIVTTEGADYIKTSTGFLSRGADIKDIILFKENIGRNVKIKASGGIRTKEEIIGFIEAGADRIGMSSVMNALNLK